MRLLLVSPLLILFSFAEVSAQNNVLTATEKREGWQLLFDGKTTSGWRAAYGNLFPERGWTVSNGELHAEMKDGAESADGGDIVTLKKYRNFDLVFDWKIGKDGNSGVKYFVEERLPKPKGSQPAYEYQLIDDTNYIYNGKHLPADLKTASIYEVIAADKPDVQVDTWHQSRIVVNHNHIEHWLDGKKVLDIDRTSDIFKQGVIDSKFKDYPNYASIPEGYILLQDHGHPAAFRNIKIRELK